MKSIRTSRFKHFKSAFQMVYATSPLLTFANFIFSFIQSFFPLLFIYLIKVLIDETSNAIGSADKEAAYSNILFWTSLTALVFLINSLATVISQYVREKQGQLFSDTMYKKLHDKATTLDLAFFENPKYHDMFYRALQDSPYRPVKIVNSMFFMFQYLIAVIILAGLLVSLHWGVGLVLLVAVVPTGLLRLKYAGKMYNWQKESTQNERKASYYSRVLTNEVFAKELRLFGIKDYFKTRFNALRDYLRISKLHIIKNKTIAESLFTLLSVAAIFFAFAFIARKAVFATLTLGSLVMYFMALQRGMSYFKELMNSFASMYEDSLYIENLNDFLSLENKPKSKSQDQTFPSVLKEGIRLNNVSFSYPNSTRKALENINLFIEKGKTIAIVGDNGAGKTTLIKLLCNLYEPDSGSILIDGTDLKQMSDEDIKSHISVLFQDFVLYHMSVKENIGFGNLKTMEDPQLMEEAARKAGIHELIQSLHSKYDTMLGKLFDQSEELSIGEWQKLAMARAFFRDAPVIILDEPTSALDPKAEYEVFKQFRDITKGRTSVIVSHRFSTVKMADFIYVMEKERIVEEGTHESLIAKNGKYAQMFRIQAENYS